METVSESFTFEGKFVTSVHYQSLVSPLPCRGKRIKKGSKGGEWDSKENMSSGSSGVMGLREVRFNGTEY